MEVRGKTVLCRRRTIFKLKMLSIPFVFTKLSFDIRIRYIYFYHSLKDTYMYINDKLTID